MTFLCKWLVFLCVLLCVVDGLIYSSVAEREAKFNQTILTHFVFASCANFKGPQGIFRTIHSSKPQLFIWGGDAVYHDIKTSILPGMFRPASLDQMKRNYDHRKDMEPYASLVRDTDIIGIYDDHDYGLNNADGSLSFKEESRRMYLSFLDEPHDSPVWNHDGAYSVHYFGPPGRRIRIILIDVRYAQSGEDLLGPRQWRWLEHHLRDKVSDADLTFFVSPIQMFPLDRPVQEKVSHHWSCFVRLMSLLSNVHGLIVLSGDVHMSSFLRSDCGLSYNVTELTSSGLTHSVQDNIGVTLASWIASSVWRSHFQLQDAHVGTSYASIDVEWEKKVVVMKILDQKGNVVQQQQVHMHDLVPRAKPSWQHCQQYAQVRYSGSATQFLHIGLIASGLSGIFAIALGLYVWCSCRRRRLKNEATKTTSKKTK